MLPKASSTFIHFQLQCVASGPIVPLTGQQICRHRLIVPRVVGKHFEDFNHISSQASITSVTRKKIKTSSSSESTTLTNIAFADTVWIASRKSYSYKAVPNEYARCLLTTKLQTPTCVQYKARKKSRGLGILFTQNDLQVLLSLCLKRISDV